MTPQQVSIAMCTYNGERYLTEQLDSIVNQTYTNLEIVICDDCSSDGTWSILEEYAGRDPRIRLLRNEKNLGFIANFEKAMNLCHGEFIALADQDDVWFANKIDTLVGEIGGHSMVYSAVQLINESGEVQDKPFPKVRRLQGDCALSLLVDNCVTGHACLLSRKILEVALPIPEGIKAHDQWLAIVASLSGGLNASAETLSYYRQHSSNAMLQNKHKRISARASKKKSSDMKIKRLVESLLDRNVSSKSKRKLLEEFLFLLERNRSTFYNKALERFLLTHQDEFLQLYNDLSKKRSVARKLSRGDKAFHLLPFI